MKFVLLFFLFLLMSNVLKTRARLRGMASDQERSLALRRAVFSWFLWFLFFGALLFFPNKQRLFVIVPAVLAVAGAGKAWKILQLRSRRGGPAPVDLERMKRVN